LYFLVNGNSKDTNRKIIEKDITIYHLINDILDQDILNHLKIEDVGHGCPHFGPINGAEFGHKT